MEDSQKEAQAAVELLSEELQNLNKWYNKLIKCLGPTGKIDLGYLRSENSQTAIRRINDGMVKIRKLLKPIADLNLVQASGDKLTKIGYDQKKELYDILSKIEDTQTAIAKMRGETGNQLEKRFEELDNDVKETGKIVSRFLISLEKPFRKGLSKNIEELKEEHEKEIMVWDTGVCMGPDDCKDVPYRLDVLKKVFSSGSDTSLDKLLGGKSGYADLLRVYVEEQRNVFMTDNTASHEIDRLLCEIKSIWPDYWGKLKKIIYDLRIQGHILGASFFRDALLLRSHQKAYQKFTSNSEKCLRIAVTNEDVSSQLSELAKKIHKTSWLEKKVWLENQYVLISLSLALTKTVRFASLGGHDKIWLADLGVVGAAFLLALHLGKEVSIYHKDRDIPDLVIEFVNHLESRYNSLASTRENDVERDFIKKLLALRVLAKPWVSLIDSDYRYIVDTHDRDTFEEFVKTPSKFVF